MELRGQVRIFLVLRMRAFFEQGPGEFDGITEFSDLTEFLTGRHEIMKYMNMKEAAKQDQNPNFAKLTKLGGG